MFHPTPRQSESIAFLLDDAVILPKLCVRHRRSLPDDHEIHPSDRGPQPPVSTRSRHQSFEPRTCLGYQIPSLQLSANSRIVFYDIFELILHDEREECFPKWNISWGSYVYPSFFGDHNQFHYACTLVLGISPSLSIYKSAYPTAQVPRWTRLHKNPSAQRIQPG